MRSSHATLLGQIGIVVGSGILAILAGVVWALVFARVEWSAASAADEVEVEVRTVAFDRGSNSPVVLLHSADRGKTLPIWVGTFEAQAIAMEIEGVSGPRPLTHDLMKTLVERLHGELERVVIEDLREHTYYATIYLRSGGAEVRIDSRPSDAIALALRFERPIFVNGTLLTGDAAVALPAEAPAVGVTRLWGLTLQEVTESLAEFFAAGDTRGVLVSDVSDEAEGSGVRRGDVITAVNGVSVSCLADLQATAAELPGNGSVRLGVGRAGVPIDVLLVTVAP
jgi:hypothetical protein